MSEILLHNHIVVVGVEWGKGSEEVRILYDILFDNMSPLVSVSVCNSECGWSSDTGAGEGERVAGWLATLFWSTLVSLAQHALLTSVSVFPAAFPCTEHRQAAPERHEYVR